MPADSPQSEPWLRIIEKLRVKETLPALRGRYLKKPDLRLARTLLVLGDATGRDQLLAGLDSVSAREAIEILDTLVNHGDAKAGASSA